MVVLGGRAVSYERGTPLHISRATLQPAGTRLDGGALLPEPLTHNPEPLTSIPYRGTSLTRNIPLLGTYRRPMPWVLGGSWGGGLFLTSVVPL